MLVPAALGQGLQMQSLIPRNSILAVAVACAVAGCNAASPGDATEARASGIGDPGLPESMMSAPGSGSEFASGFADLPDHGDLVAYPRERVARRAGASTWHRADVSEDHALRAIGGGELAITAPSGQSLRFRYERHVEHASGDWTWFGRSIVDPAQEAVLTFGSQAVFGSMGRAGGAPLEIATRDGASWIVERESAPIDGPSVQAASAQAAHVPAPATIDVLVGYTAGFARARGGTAAEVAPVMTRLHFLVDNANASFAARGVGARLRLVHAMPVDYSDIGEDTQALRALAQSGGSSSDSAAALQPLHAARDSRGADVVALVRDYRQAQGTGCGTAGPLDGMQAGGAASGMVVVADGEAGTAACGPLTLASQLEALVQAATPAAVAAYRAAASPAGRPRNDFNGDGISDLFWHNVDTEQNRGWLSAMAATPLAIGSAPGWQPMGTGDFDGDGKADIFWRHADRFDGRNGIWLAGDRNRSRPLATLGGDQWNHAGTGDFDGDGRSDLLWRGGAGRNVVWPAADATLAWETGKAGGSWIVAGIGDFNGDGRDDIFWRNPLFTGDNVIWLSGDSRTQMSAATYPSKYWQVRAINDFDGDGRDDVFWRNSETGGNELWPGADAASRQPVAGVHLDWAVGSTGDFNGDGRGDLAWRNGRTGSNTSWLSANPGTPKPLASVTDLDWQMVD